MELFEMRFFWIHFEFATYSSCQRHYGGSLRCTHCEFQLNWFRICTSLIILYLRPTHCLLCLQATEIGPYIWSKATGAICCWYFKCWFNWGNQGHCPLFHVPLFGRVLICVYIHVIAPIRIKTDKEQFVWKHSTGACRLCCGVFWNIF